MGSGPTLGFDAVSGLAWCLLLPAQQMTLKIETLADGQTTTLRLVGRIDSEHLEELQTQVQRYRSQLVLDLGQVTLVDIAVVRFFNDCETAGIQLLDCAPYIRAWMGGEK